MLHREPAVRSDRIPHPTDPRLGGIIERVLDGTRLSREDGAGAGEVAPDPTCLREHAAEDCLSLFVPPLNYELIKSTFWLQFQCCHLMSYYQ